VDDFDDEVFSISALVAPRICAAISSVLETSASD